MIAQSERQLSLQKGDSQLAAQKGADYADIWVFTGLREASTAAGTVNWSFHSRTWFYVLTRLCKVPDVVNTLKIDRLDSWLCLSCCSRLGTSCVANAAAVACQFIRCSSWAAELMQ
jgi:hypothetical protein